jgi:hypothetical protein
MADEVVNEDNQDLVGDATHDCDQRGVRQVGIPPFGPSAQPPK